MFNKEKVYQLLPEYWLIKVNSFDDIAKDTLDEWIYFLKNEEIRDDFSAKGLEKAKQELDIMKLSEEERRAYSRYLDNLHYQASMAESTWTAGMLEGKRAVALNLLESGLLDIEKVAEMTGLALEEVQRLVKEKDVQQGKES
ncbi:MAG: hypothetical protein SD837_12205 [Candidatus Electrothrix scaldis]|nr:MAG: hypothetical protein SD837_12205 [Candidatus Electrothrix sp. GW3-3]